jgi:hypothetical protein
MRIYQLLSGIDIALTNEEQLFVEKYNRTVSLASLKEHDQWVAQNLVRRGIYSISNDNKTLIKKVHEKNI